jgi:hypothetical protein
VPALPYVPPELGFFSARRFRRLSFWVAVAFLAVAGIGAVIMTPPGARLSDAAVPPAGQITTAETIPTASPVGFAAVDQAAIVTDTRVVADKSFCVGGQPSDGNCVAFQLPKVRMVRVPRAASIGQQDNLAKSGVAATRSSGLDKGVTEPEKAQRSAHRPAPRSTQPRREARRSDWTARRYASRDRSEYGRQGFARSLR